MSPNSPAPTAEASGEYVVVARRYRPQTFEDLVGQGQVSQALRNAINTHRVGHAYLFTGARGVGKTSTARIFAKALNCVRGPTPTPCNECDICLGVTQGGDVDVIEIDGASNRGIDEIRQLRSNVSVRPSRARFKIYIIDEVHMLTTAAFNALLKTLEEPPEHVKFIFCTTDPEKIPITVLSRCQRFDFPPVEADSIIGRLRLIVKGEGLEADEEALRLLGRRAAGSMRDSQSLLEQLLAFTTGRITVEDVHKMLGTAGGNRLAKLAQHLVNRDAAAALGELEHALHQSIDVGQLSEQLLGYFRDVMAVAVGCPPDLLLHASASDYAELQELARRLGLETTLAAVQVLDQAVTKMRHSVHARVLLEVALVRICKLEDLEELAQLAARLQAGGAFPAATTRAAGPAATSAISASAPPLNTEKKKWTEVSAAQASDVEPPTHAPVTLAPASSATWPQTQAVASGLAYDDRPGESGEESLPATAMALQATTVRQVWEAALEQLEDMTADFGRFFASLTVPAPDRLVVGFRPEYTLQKQSCDRPDRRAKIEQAVSQIVGRVVKVEFELLPGEAKVVERRAAPASRAVRIREREKYPLVQQAKAMFDAEIVDVVEPRGDGSHGDART